MKASVTRAPAVQQGPDSHAKGELSVAAGHLLAGLMELAGIQEIRLVHKDDLSGSRLELSSYTRLPGAPAEIWHYVDTLASGIAETMSRFGLSGLALLVETDADRKRLKTMWARLARRPEPQAQQEPVPEVLSSKEPPRPPKFMPGVEEIVL